MKILFLLTLFISTEVHSFSNDQWMHYSKHQDANIKRLLELLSRSTTGKDLLEQAKQKAAEKGETLVDLIKPGNVSITDTTLTRRFSVRNPGSMSFSESSVVYIDKSLKTYDALLDLAHELTHFIYRRPFNPYDAKFSLNDFVHSTVEGTGGEVDAYMMECRVMQELFSSDVAKRYSCEEIKDPSTGKISRDMAINKFYRIGHHKKTFGPKLQVPNVEKEFSHLSEEEPVFISSAYGLPYPVAAYYEYVSVLNRVCENDKNRLSYMKSAVDRSPASEDGTKKQNAKAFEDNYQARCHNLEVLLASLPER